MIQISAFQTGWYRISSTLTNGIFSWIFDGISFSPLFRFRGVYKIWSWRRIMPIFLKLISAAFTVLSIIVINPTTICAPFRHLTTPTHHHPYQNQDHNHNCHNMVHYQQELNRNEDMFSLLHLNINLNYL